MEKILVFNKWPKNSPFSAVIDVGLDLWDYLIVFRSHSKLYVCFFTMVYRFYLHTLITVANSFVYHFNRE